MLVCFKVNINNKINVDCSSKLIIHESICEQTVLWEYMKYDIRTTDFRVVSHPSFQVYGEPVWHIHHFKSLLNFFFKIYFPKVFNFTCLYIKRNVQVLKFRVLSHNNTSNLLLDFHMQFWFLQVLQPGNARVKGSNFSQKNWQ